MSEILDRLKNLENERPTVLRPAATVPARRRASVRRARYRVILFFAIALSATFLGFQMKTHFYPVETVAAPTVDLAQIQNELNQLAIDAYQKGDFKTAVEKFEKLVSEHPERSEYHVNLGMAYQQSSNSEKALQQLKLATTLDPKNSFAFNNLGLIAEQQKQFGLAQQSLEKAIELNPTAPELRINLAAFYEKTGQLDKSVAIYQSYVRLPAANQELVDLVKKRIPRLNSLNAQSEREAEGL